MKVITAWKQWAKRLKTKIYTLYLAYKDPRTPWYARVFAAVVVGYAFSPIDLIPDFIPVLGYLDDLVLLPIGVVLAIKMIPPEVVPSASSTLISNLQPSGHISGILFSVILFPLPFNLIPPFSKQLIGRFVRLIHHVLRHRSPLSAVGNRLSPSAPQ